METIDEIKGLSRMPGPHHLAIGVFDGLHLGHKAVIGEALYAMERRGGSAIVATFDPHPSRVLRPENPQRLLASLEHKKRLIGAMGVHCLLVIPFDQTLSKLSADEFLSALVEGSGDLATVCVGHDWRFGSGRKGSLEHLQKFAETAGFEVIPVNPVVCDNGSTISSTRIRIAVQNGDFNTAKILLGRDYTLLGRVIEGDRLGGKIGFPTANLTVFNEELPPDGVYAVDAVLKGAAVKGVGNLGIRPTINETEARRRLEVHLFDFDDDVYGELMEVRFRGFIRPEQKFDGIASLKEQIAFDAQQAREMLASEK